MFQPTNVIDCALSMLPSARPIKNQAPVHFHCGTAEMLARVVLLEGKVMEPGARSFVQLRLADPGLFVPSDRFIIRQFSPVITIGGGVVLDSAPPKHRPGDPSTVESLRVLESGTPEAQLELLVQRMGEAAPVLLAARTGWKSADVLQVARSLANQKRVVLLGQPPGLLIHAAHFSRLAKLLVEQLGLFHQTNPLVAGLPKEDLRAKLATGRTPRSLPSPALLSALLQTMTSLGKIYLQGELVCLQGRTIQLSAEEVASRDQIAAAFEKAGLAVPGTPEVMGSLRIDRARAEKLLNMLVKENILHKVTGDLIFHRSALGKLRELLARRKVQNPRISVPDFKNLTGISRKYAIPLLEYLDRERVTRREGDVRIIL